MRAFLVSLLLLSPPLLAADPATFERDVKPFLVKHCLDCHGAEKQKGDLRLDGYRDATAASKDAKVWDAVAKKIRDREMPPKARPRPAAAEQEALLHWIDATILKVGATGPRDPGRVTLRRLNKYEYNYTIRDLIGLDLKPADDFPADEVGYGFDNIGDVLTLPPILVERYLATAEKVLEKAIAADLPRGAKASDSHRRILFVEPTGKADRRDTARKILERFASRAYRRPAKTEEVARLLKLFDLAERAGETFERGIQVSCSAVLSSPHFLFRVELDSEPGNHTAVHPVTDWELASRLSYFLWSSLPDDELSEHARKGTLRQDGNLEKQTRRLIADGKSRGLLKTFSALWLGSRQMKSVSPDPDQFPRFDEELRDAMRRETEMFFDEVMRKDLSVLTFLDADFTFLNERLGKHYGIAGVKGAELKRVELRDTVRGGVLTQGTVLTVTSNPTRTSPVKRGKWILEQILGTPPPAPPPGNDSLKEDGGEALKGTLRQRTEQHRANPECATCHEKMDPLGFALENFDAVGKWREQEGKLPIDASAVLPDGTRFTGAPGLKQALLARSAEFSRALAEKMLTFALGRGLELSDREAVDGIVKRLQDNELRFSALVLGVVTSRPFLYRRGERVGE